MRTYTFSMFYLASIQAGIQSLHVVAEMFIKYRMPNGVDIKGSHADQLYTWATDHKTVVLLNGGDAEALNDMRTFLHEPDNPYPHAFFEESLGAMNGCLTSVGIVLPERMYDADSTRVGHGVAKALPWSWWGRRPLSLQGDMIERIENMWDEDMMKIMKERLYTEWELRFLARRVVCKLAI